MKTRSTFVLAALTVLFSANAVAQVKLPPMGAVKVGRIPDEKDGEIAVRGLVRVPVSVAAAFEEATDFQNWPQELPDIEKFELLEQASGHAKVKYKSSIIGVDTTTEFKLDAPRGMTFKSEGFGLGDVRGVMQFTPTEGGTLAVLTITSRRKGFASRFAPSSTIRSRLERKIRSDLTALARDTGASAQGGSGK